MARDRRKVRATIEGFLIGREKHREGPTAASTRENLCRFLIDVVEIGSFFPIYLDVDEMLVHEGGDLGVLKRLVCHHMTPMAGRVADGQEDRFVLVLCPR